MAANSALPGRTKGASTALALQALGWRGDVGTEVFERRQPDAGLEDEHAAVPGVITTGEVALGGGEVGLFDKLGDRVIVVLTGFTGAADVAVAGFRAVGRDAQDHDIAAGCCANGVLQGGGEGLGVLNGLVRRRDDKDRVATVGSGLQRGQGERRCGIATNGFQQKRGGNGLQFTQLVERQKAVLLVRDH